MGIAAILLYVGTIGWVVFKLIDMIVDNRVPARAEMEGVIFLKRVLKDTPALSWIKAQKHHFQGKQTIS